MKAAEWDLLPYWHEPESGSKGVSLAVKTSRGHTFASPVGIGAGLCIDGQGIDAMIRASGMDQAGVSTFIECGSCAPERQ